MVGTNNAIVSLLYLFSTLAIIENDNKIHGFVSCKQVKAAPSVGVSPRLTRASVVVAEEEVSTLYS